MSGCYRNIVAMSAEVPIYADRRIAAITFANSPYYAHTHLSAIDLYPTKPDDPVLSPVRGEVIGIRAVKAPNPKYFKADEDEKLVLIDNGNGVVTKILHLKPSLSIGDSVEVSAPIGEHVRSGFFNFWTRYHIHVETRPVDDLIRARGSFPMTPRSIGKSQDSKTEGIDPSCIQCAAVRTSPEFLLVQPRDDLFSIQGGYSGLRVSVGQGVTGILDGGLPHYRIGGVLLSSADQVKPSAPVNLGNLRIGKVIEEESYWQRSGSASYLPIKFSETLDVRFSGLAMRGLSLFLGLFRRDPPVLKVVPSSPIYKDKLYEIGDDEVLSIRG